MRGFRTLARARAFCRAHAFLRNLRGQFEDIGWRANRAPLSPPLTAVRAWETPTAAPVAREIPA
jgi:hypothetical protein